MKTFKTKRKSKGLVVKPGEAITIKLFDKCEGCDEVDKCENLGECRKDPFINARNAYRLYRKRYVDLLNLLCLNSKCDSGALEESISLCRTAEKNMFEKMDILFGEVKS